MKDDILIYAGNMGNMTSLFFFSSLALCYLYLSSVFIVHVCGGFCVALFAGFVRRRAFCIPFIHLIDRGIVTSLLVALCLFTI